MKTSSSGSVAIPTIAFTCLLLVGVSCSDTKSECVPGRWCNGGIQCQDGSPDSGCETIYTTLFGIKIADDSWISCGRCNPNPIVHHASFQVGASLETAGTCPRNVHHSVSVENPGCWFNWCLPWPWDDECWHDCYLGCSIEGTCYHDVGWDEVVYDPEPFYGGCP
jgi:hypothetical protein